jgi:hypothetical protein
MLRGRQGDSRFEVGAVDPSMADKNVRTTGRGEVVSLLRIAAPVILPL